MSWGDVLNMDVAITQPTEEDVKRFNELNDKGLIDENGNELDEKGKIVGRKEFQKDDVVMPNFISREEIASKEKEASKSQVTKAKTPEAITPKQFETNLDKELKKVLEDIDFDKIPNKEAFDKKLAKLQKNIRKQIFTKSSALTKAVYNKAARKVSRELGKAYEPTKEDKETVDKLKVNPKKEDALEDLSKNTFNRAKDVINKAFEDKTLTIDSVVKQLGEEMDKSKSELRTIARTESTKIAIGSRKTQYQKTGRFDELRFKWIGPDDNRTGEDSKEIKELTKNGVTWGIMVDIIRSVAKKHNSKWTVDDLSPIPRPNTRHLPVRIV